MKVLKARGKYELVMESAAAAMPHVSKAGLIYAPIANDLGEVEQVFDRTIESSDSQLAELVNQIRGYRGKRLRPVLLLLTGQAVGEVRRAHHVLGAVVEMIHTATLVHDDVLDAARIRRHSTTVNADWGNKTSILLGDYLFTHAFHLTSTLGDASACEIIGESTNRVCEGELLQTLKRGKLDLGEDEYFNIIDGKTAALTACCCQLGAKYAGGSNEVIRSMTDYGRLLGLAFQVADDLLDVVGTESRAGKTLGTDLEQQKMTLPLIYMLDRVPAVEADRLKRVLGSISSNKFDEIKSALESTSAIRDSRRRAEQFAHDAATRLAVLPSSPAKEILTAMTEWVVARDV